MRHAGLIVVATFAIARADAPKPSDAGAVLAATPREQAMRLYAQATKMFADEDWIAAAVTFGQVHAILARVDRDATGAVVDREAHSYRNAALSNKATSYARGGLYVEAYNAFEELRAQFAAELSETEREEVDEALARMADRIGSVKLTGIPETGDVEVRIDGRLERRDVRGPLRMSEGDHSIDVKAVGYKPYIDEITVVHRQELALALALAPLKTPAKLRVESSVERSRIAIDGIARGAAPIEISLTPGTHRVEVASESYVTQTTEVALKPGERAILRIGMVPARAPLGLRITPAFLASVPLHTDTPFGRYDSGIGLQLYHDTLRIRALRFGLNFEYHPRALNSVGLGLVGTWCPDAVAWRNGTIAWCPVTGALDYVFGDRRDAFRSGEADARMTTAFEFRRGAGFARLAIGFAVEDYVRETPTSDGVASTFLILWSAAIDASVGLDL